MPLQRSAPQANRSFYVGIMPFLTNILFIVIQIEKSKTISFEVKNSGCKSISERTNRHSKSYPGKARYYTRQKDVVAGG
jgi:hypothetical protein